MQHSLSLNYTNVCWYCGQVYMSNRCTSRYCCSKHNSLYSQYGSQIKPLFNDRGEIFNFDDILGDIYIKGDLEDGYWSPGHSCWVMREDFAYYGPLPMANELVVIGYYVIRAKFNLADKKLYYSVKLFYLLRDEEKRGSLIIQGKMDY